MRRKILVVTGARADYWLLRRLMRDIAETPDLELQVLATGMHLSPEFGSTYQAIEKDGFHIDWKLEMLLSSDTPVGVSTSMGLGLIGFGQAFDMLSPDIVLLLGDRFELLCASTAALVAGIPIAHIHGGERTEGAFDDAFRHSITKMAHLHFVAAEEYRRRVIQLGENPSRVFHVGGLGVDNAARAALMSRSDLEAALNFRLGKRNLLVTFHPVTLQPDRSAAQLEELLAALARLTDTRIIITMPNADTEGRRLARLIEDFAAVHDHVGVFTALGEEKYLSCLSHVDGVVGNSSSGLLEAPTFHVGTVNIGTRQAGRLRAESVIDCPPEREAILAALTTIQSPAFSERLKYVVNPYGPAGAAARIVAVLRAQPLEGLLQKSFYDLDNSTGA